MEGTRYNDYARPFITEKMNSWYPFSSYASMLWPVFAGESIYKNGYWVRHLHCDSMELLVILDGDMTVTSENEAHLVSAGETANIPPGFRKLETGPSGFCHKLSVGIDGNIFRLVMKVMNLDRFAIMKDFMTPEFERLYQRIATLLDARDPATIPELSNLAYSALMYVSMRKEMQHLPRELQDCKSFIERNLHRKITVSDICGLVKCSKAKLNRLFSTYLKTSPVEYLIRLRLDYACRLLAMGNLSIKEIASLCGYRNQLYFSNDFKKHTSLTPTAFRNSKKSAPMDLRSNN